MVLVADFTADTGGEGYAGGRSEATMLEGKGGSMDLVARFASHLSPVT